MPLGKVPSSCNNVEHAFLGTGVYYHTGLRLNLLRISEIWLRRINLSELKLQLDYDSLSVSKSSNQQLWPILGLVASHFSEIFMVGIYSGDFNEMSAAVVDELEELLTIGLNVDKHQVHLTLKLVAVICDIPARSSVRYVVGHNGTAGCDKCEVLRARLNGRMTLPNGEHDLRSDVTFRSQTRCHHRGRSSL